MLIMENEMPKSKKIESPADFGKEFDKEGGINAHFYFEKRMV